MTNKIYEYKDDQDWYVGVWMSMETSIAEAHENGEACQRL